MATQWGYGPKNFSITAGSDHVIALDVPHRGTIKQINLQQSNGGDSGVFEIYDAEIAAEVGAESSSVSALASGDPAAHSITDGEVAISAGSYRAAWDVPYINRDGSISLPVRRLWMRINITGSGDKDFTLSMTIEPSDI